MFTPASLREVLVQHEVPASDLDVLLGAARPAIRLLTTPEPDESHIRVGATKIGGRPDLPPDLDWPVRPPYADAPQRAARYREPVEWAWLDEAGRADVRAANERRTQAVSRAMPLGFVAQLDFAELAAAGATDLDLPSSGHLWLFYDLAETPWGYDPAEREGFAVRFEETGAVDLARRDPPPELALLTADAAGIPAQRVELTATLTTIEPHILDWDAVLASEAGREAYEEARWDWIDEPGWSAHRVGGWPSMIQGDMATEAALVTAGFYCGNGDAGRRPEAAPVRATADQWVLLLQVASDDDGASWGDSGMLYLWIRRDDLAARRFEKAHLILQCF